MIVPCGKCIVKARCMHRINNVTYNGYDIYYIFDGLLQECSELRKYFGIDTPQHRVKLRSPFTLPGAMIRENPDGSKLVEAFLKTMHIKKMPKKDFPVKRVRGKRAKKCR